MVACESYIALTLKVPEKLQLYGPCVYCVVHSCDIGMLRVKGEPKSLFRDSIENVVIYVKNFFIIFSIVYALMRWFEEKNVMLSITILLFNQ